MQKSKTPILNCIDPASRLKFPVLNTFSLLLLLFSSARTTVAVILTQALQKGLETREKGHESSPVGRLFYLALPPTVYPQASA